MDFHKTPTLLIFLLLNLGGGKLLPFSDGFFLLQMQILSLQILSWRSHLLPWFYFHWLINPTFLFGALVSILNFRPGYLLTISRLTFRVPETQSWSSEVVRASHVDSDPWVWILTPPPWITYPWAFIFLALISSPHLHFWVRTQTHTCIFFLFLRKTGLI